uniref:FecR domain-containing protein n=1 Tax=Roseihalotalea indica TaxID=2867963 RepID=A0AA49GTG3_9BACT|nr:FecR domain-containing protein [Tunicatimonas sp. TK19036]
MKYLNYSVEDFIADPYFQEGISGNNESAAAFWATWAQDHPEKQPEMEEAARFLKQLQFKTSDLSSEEFLEIWDDILTNRDIPRYKLSPASPNRRRYWFSAAAVLLILSMTGAIFFLQDSLWPSTTVVQTEYSDTREVKLPDGSLAILNSNSQLRFKDHWQEDEVREVILEGEAYFSVKHTQQHQKFIVHSGDLIIEVLGTEFNVNNRRGDNKVMLEKGRVRLDMTQLPDVTATSTQQPLSLVMEPGELVQVSSSADVSRKIVNPEQYSSWTKNQLIFDNTSLAEIIKMIEDNYGYAVYTKGLDINELRFSGELHSRDLNLLLSFLSEAFNLQISTTDKKIILAKNNAP